MGHELFSSLYLAVLLILVSSLNCYIKELSNTVPFKK